MDIFQRVHGIVFLFHFVHGKGFFVRNGSVDFNRKIKIILDNIKIKEYNIFIYYKIILGALI